MPSDSDVIYGLLGLSGGTIALPLSNLIEVVPCPDSFAKLPAEAHGLLGAMELRQLIIPVLDLQAALGLVGEPAAERVVAIIGDGQKVLGVLVDSATGVVSVSSNDLQPLEGGSERMLVSHTFILEDGAVTSLLDAEAVLTMHEIPTARAVKATNVVTSQVAIGDRKRLTLLKCGSYVIGIDVVDVHTTMPGATPRTSVWNRGECLGVTSFRGLDVPVVDPLQVLGLGKMSERIEANVIVQFPRGFLALAFTGLLDIVEINEGHIMPVASMALPKPELLDGIVQFEEFGVCFVLNADVLRSGAEMESLSSLITVTEKPADPTDLSLTADGILENLAALNEQTTPSIRDDAFVTYRSGVELATPLAQIDEVIPFPRDFVPTGVGGSTLGVIVHRDRVIPIVSLPELLGTTRPDIKTTCLLLISAGEGQVAFAVERLHTVDGIAWRDPEFADQKRLEFTTPEAFLNDAELIQVGESTAFLPDLQLTELAKAIVAVRV